MNTSFFFLDCKQALIHCGTRKAAVRDKHGKGPGTKMTFLWGLPTSSLTALSLLGPQHVRACSQAIVLWSVSTTHPTHTCLIAPSLLGYGAAIQAGS